MWDIRTGGLVKTLETGKEVTSIEVSRDGRHITTADGTEVHICPKSYSTRACLKFALCPHRLELAEVHLCSLYCYSGFSDCSNALGPVELKQACNESNHSYSSAYLGKVT